MLNSLIALLPIKNSTTSNTLCYYWGVSYFIAKAANHCLNFFIKKLNRNGFILFELELFFISHDVFIFIFFIYSLLNRFLFIFLFVLLCIVTLTKTHFFTKVYVL